MPKRCLNHLLEWSLLIAICLVMIPFAFIGLFKGISFDHPSANAAGLKRSPHGQAGNRK